MSTDFILRVRRKRDLTPESLGAAVAAIAAAAELRLAVVNGEVRWAVELSAEDPRALAVGFSIDGASLTLSSRGRGADLALWLAGALARRLKGTVHDPQEGAAVTPDAAADAVREMVRAHEREVCRAAPASCPYDAADLRMLLGGLLAARAIEVPEPADPRLNSLVPLLGLPRGLYGALLEHPAVDEVFVDETEFIAFWERFVG